MRNYCHLLIRDKNSSLFMLFLDQPKNGNMQWSLLIVIVTGRFLSKKTYFPQVSVVLVRERDTGTLRKFRWQIVDNPEM